MKAAILNNYHKRIGDLTICDVPVPEIRDNEVLVRIKAAGVNPLDNLIERGDVKIILPYKLPLIMGNEFCGIIDKVGKAVVNFKEGERVYGRMPLKKTGAFAEYAAVDENAIAKVPEYLSDEEAASVPLTALTALQAFEIMNAASGETIFISGGTGSLGAMAIPIAKSIGLTVITNGSKENKERVLSLGADRFIDYKTEDYLKSLSRIDHVLDTLGVKELKKEFSILKHGGTLVSLRGLPNGEFASRTGMPPLKQLLFTIVGHKFDKMAAKNGSKYYFINVHEDGKGLQRISEMLESRRIKTSVDRIYELSEINQALRKVADRGSRGKTIIRID